MADSIFLGYIEKFSFRSKEMADKLSGHPMVGRIYRIIETDGFYRIHIGRDNNKYRLDGILLGDTLSGNFYDKWEFEIKKVDKENYLDFNLAPDDLSKIGEWLDTDNADLKELLSKDISPVPIETATEEGLNPANVMSEEDLRDYVRKLRETSIVNEEAGEINLFGRVAEKDLLVGIGQDLNHLIDKDVDILYPISDILAHISSCYDDKYEGGELPNLSKQICLSKTLGKGANVFNALKYLQRYASEGFEKSENVVDIYKAIHYLIFELQRRIQINGK